MATVKGKHILIVLIGLIVSPPPLKEEEGGHCLIYLLTRFTTG